MDSNIKQYLKSHFDGVQNDYKHGKIKYSLLMGWVCVASGDALDYTIADRLDHFLAHCKTKGYVPYFNPLGEICFYEDNIVNRIIFIVYSLLSIAFKGFVAYWLFMLILFMAELTLSSVTFNVYDVNRNMLTQAIDYLPSTIMYGIKTVLYAVITFISIVTFIIALPSVLFPTYDVMNCIINYIKSLHNKEK